MLRLLTYLHKKYGRSGSQLARVCLAWVMANIVEVSSTIADLSCAIGLEDSAQAFYDQQRYAEAAPLFERVVAARQAALGHSDLSIAAPLSNLANCISYLRPTEESEPLFKRSLAICEAAGNAGDTYLATALNNLAVHYAKLGKHKEAELLFQRSLNHAEARLDTRSFAISVHNYICMLQQLKRGDDIEELKLRLTSLCSTPRL